MLERLFQLKAHNTTVRTEVLAGITTFLTMAYILFVNPEMLAKTGMDHGAVFVATCLAGAIGSLIMGLLANYPIALAPGMGLNAFFTYTVVMTMGYSWQTALGAVFLSGAIFFLLSIFKIREWIINSIPLALRAGIAAGIGLFLAIIALKNAGIVVDHPATLVGLGDMSKGGALLACLGFFVIAALAYRKVTGAVMIGILLVTGLSIVLGLSELQGVVSMPPSLMPTLLQLDIAGALDIGLISVIFAFLFVDLFDTSGTLVGVAQKADLLDKDGKMPRLGRALMADSTATMAGAALGTSTTTSYIESAAGISTGGRTGLTAVFTAMFFVLTLFMLPIFKAIPEPAILPVLVAVGVIMFTELGRMDFANMDTATAAGAFFAILLMPLTFSITNGLAAAFVVYTAVKLLKGEFKDLNLGLLLITVISLIVFYVHG